MFDRAHVDLFESFQILVQIGQFRSIRVQIETNATLNFDVFGRFPENEEGREQMRVAIRNRRIRNVRRAAKSVVRTDGRRRAECDVIERLKGRREPRRINLISLLIGVEKCGVIGRRPARIFVEHEQRRVLVIETISHVENRFFRVDRHRRRRVWFLLPESQLEQTDEQSDDADEQKSGERQNAEDEIFVRRVEIQPARDFAVMRFQIGEAIVQMRAEIIELLENVVQPAESVDDDQFENFLVEKFLSVDQFQGDVINALVQRRAVRRFEEQTSISVEEKAFGMKFDRMNLSVEIIEVLQLVEVMN